MGSNHKTVRCLAALLILLSCQSLAYAEVGSGGEFELQSGTIDDTKMKSEPLSGHVDKSDVEDNGSAYASINNEADIDEETTRPLSDTESEKVLQLLKKAGYFKRFLGAVDTNPTIEMGALKPQLSAEEYRKMEYGVIGLDALLPLNGPGPLVTHLIPGTPADIAGIREGDLIVKAKDHVFKHGEGQRVLWQIVAGRAGTPVDLTILRDGQLIKFEMLRMNIEDLPDKRRRRQYESLLSALGAPHYTSDGDLAQSTIKDNEDMTNLKRSSKKLFIDFGR
jgi:hypothetical protein